MKVPYVNLLKGHLIRIRTFSVLTTFMMLDKHCITVLYSQLLKFLTDASFPIRADEILLKYIFYPHHEFKVSSVAGQSLTVIHHKYEPGILIVMLTEHGSTPPLIILSPCL